MEKITSRAVIGTFYKALMALSGSGWINPISNFFPSTQSIEEYPWLGSAPVMNEWLGPRRVIELIENYLQIRNKHYEASIEIALKDLRRDKTGQALVRIADLARRSNSHWAGLLSALIIAGESTPCYDGQYFFDTDHSEGSSGSQSNDISCDISGYPVAVHGAAASAPSVSEMQFVIASAIQAIVGFKDDQGQPMNEDATGFLVMAPVSLMNTVAQAVVTPAQVAESQSALVALKGNFAINYAINPRLTWTDKIVIFRTDDEVKAFIRQEEKGVSFKMKDENSDFAFDNDAIQCGVDSWRAVGYGLWQKACLATMV